MSASLTRPLLNIFSGQSYLNPLVNNEDLSVANVVFEPGCRNH